MTPEEYEKRETEKAAKTKVILEALREPFDAELISWKPQITKGDRAMCTAYADPLATSH